MTNSEIKERINEINREIEQVFTAGIFTLNNQIQELKKERRELQDQCSHEFDNGVCKFCGKSEK